MCANPLVGVMLTCLLTASAATFTAWAAPGTAAAPHASVPSVAVTGRAVTVSGGGFVPGEVVTLRIIGPSRRAEMAAVVAAADGSISHSMVTSAPGTYRIVLVNSAGRALANELRLVASN